MPTTEGSMPGQSEISSENDEKRDCDVENERMLEKGKGKAKRGESDSEEDSLYLIFHSNLATLSPKIDEFVAKAREMCVERQKKEDKKDVNVDETSDKPAGADQAAAEEADAKEKTKEALEVHMLVNRFTRFVEAKIYDYQFVEWSTNWRQEEGTESPFLENVVRLHQLAEALSLLGRSEPAYTESFNHVNSALHKAMVFTEEEFRSILKRTAARNQNSEASTSSSRQDSTDESSYNELEFPGYSTDQISDLIKLAHTMISTGYGTECCQTYSIMRRDIFEECLVKKLSFEKRSIDETLKMNWEILRREMSIWITNFRLCAKIHFPGERRLAQSIFTEHKHISDAVYINVCKGVMMQLLNIAEAVAMTKHSAEKLSKLLDMYILVRDFISTLYQISQQQYVDEIKSDALSAKRRLSQAAVYIFRELENSLESDTNRTPIPGGAVHPLTRYTIKCLKCACEYKSTLEEVFKDHQKVQRADSTSKPEKAHKSLITAYIVKVRDLIDSYLESRSKFYKDLSLSYIFLMNNSSYILKRIKDDIDIKDVMGVFWGQKHSSELESNQTKYMDETWGEVLECLSWEDLTAMGEMTPTLVLKEKFTDFNTLFEEIHRTQSAWIVSDEQLRSGLLESISREVIPAYRSIFDSLVVQFMRGREKKKYVKHQPEDIRRCVLELFSGNPNTS